MLKLENVTKYYHTSSSVTCALSKVNLEFNIGEFVIITGESGSGKTTLLNVISGLDTYEDGELYYNGQPTSHYSDEELENYRKTEIAFIFQNYNLIESFTVLENVMIPLIIDGYKMADAKTKALVLLDEVGLIKLKNKKVIKLSGGEKQRVSIARALAKETNIIIADEPTGNLDTENGKMIMELLKRVSKHKLVIVVTHNVAEAEPYSTRKIRLHDGQVVMDEVKHVCDEQKIEPITHKMLKPKIPWSFLGLNFKAQPKRTLLLFFIILVGVFTTFICTTTFVVNLDDTKTKTLSDEIFINHDTKRLLVKETNGSIITNDIIKKAKVKNVKEIERFDYITDINYFRPEDCSTLYLGGWQDSKEGQIFIDNTTFYVKNRDHFMRSSSSLTSSSLRFGKLPDGYLEMVVYSNDNSILNTTETVYFSNPKKWGIDTVVQYEVKIVGILKEPSVQAYFSDDICKMMELTSLTTSLRYKYEYETNFSHKRTALIDYKYIMIDYQLQGKHISLSERYYDTYLTNKNSSDFFLEDNQLSLNIGKENETYETKIIDQHKFKAFENALGVSPELFNEIYQTILEKRQFAVYIDDYAYTDDVIKALSSNDLQAISCYRSSVVGYDMDKVVARYLTLVIVILSGILINVIVVLLCYTILKLKKNDYVIFRMLGLSKEVNKRINYIEMLVYTILTSILLIITVAIIKHFTTNIYLLEYIKYIRPYHYIICFVISLVIALIISYNFNKYLQNKVKITALKEE